MNIFPPSDSVGLVKPVCHRFDTPLCLRCGKTLPEFQLMTETYGRLNARRSNAVLVCPALSGDHHAAGYYRVDDRKPGWWENSIGPGKPIDTNRFFVVSVNNLGGCAGSTGPTTINPATGNHYGPDFPVVTVRDWVASQALLADKLGIEQWAAVIGGSLGGMQVLRWAISHPQRLRHAIAIAAAAKLSAQNIAFNEVARQSIISDRDFHDGRYLDHGTRPHRGLMLARMVGHITYLSDTAMRAKFGRNLPAGIADVTRNLGRDLRSGKLSFGFDVDFQVESYLRYQGENFSAGFDANTYLLMTKALDYFDPAMDYGGDLSEAFREGDCRFLLMSFSTDWRFPPERSRELLRDLLRAGRTASYVEVATEHGHDAFLLRVPRYLKALGCYMERVHEEIAADAP